MLHDSVGFLAGFSDANMVNANGVTPNGVPNTDGVEKNRQLFYQCLPIMVQVRVTREG